MTDCKGWTVELENIKRMKIAGEPILAAQKILEEGRMGQMNGHGTPDVVTNGKEFESPAIPVICLQQVLYMHYAFYSASYQDISLFQD
jgi:hypothetical protein